MGDGPVDHHPAVALSFWGAAPPNDIPGSGRF
jgi:hypothetical protein